MICSSVNLLRRNYWSSFLAFRRTLIINGPVYGEQVKPRANDDAADSEEGLMNVCTPFEAYPQLTKLVQPAQRPAQDVL